MFLNKSIFGGDWITITPAFQPFLECFLKRLEGLFMTGGLCKILKLMWIRFSIIKSPFGSMMKTMDESLVQSIWFFV